jgi:hypothetical protein
MTRKEAALKTQEDRRKAKVLDKLKAESGVLVKLAEFDMKPEIVSDLIHRLESVVPLTPQQILERDHLERLRELRKIWQS